METKSKTMVQWQAEAPAPNTHTHTYNKSCGETSKMPNAGKSGKYSITLTLTTPDVTLTGCKDCFINTSTTDRTLPDTLNHFLLGLTNAE